MLGRFSVAWLLAASPALANDPAPSQSPAGQEYRVKKVCRTVEVAGSFIPRTSCVNKKIPIKKPEVEAPGAPKTSGSADASSSGQKEQ